MYYDMINNNNNSINSGEYTLHNDYSKPTRRVGRSNQALLLAVGIPGSIDVGLGSILGTLKTNIPLASHVPLSFLTTGKKGNDNNNT